MVQHYDIIVRGKVQGVFYRATTKEKAEQLGLVGTVSNESDGSVHISVEGEQEDLDQFLSYCHSGPCCAEVDSVQVEGGEVVGYQGFEVIQ